MKKYSFTLCALFVLAIAHAQYVTIPDANFAAYLHTIIPSAMSGNQMDTTNPTVAALTRIDVENMGILDITGVQYFRNLVTLDCGNGSPSVDSNHITSLPAPLATTLDSLICGNNQITNLPTLPAGLQYLACYLNKLTSLPTLPGTLIFLECGDNQITSLPSLPGNLTHLYCYYNQITSLLTLPGTLQTLSCYNNPITTLPVLPGGLTELDCMSNQLTNLPTLPGTLKWISCDDNQITNLPTLPGGLIQLNCSDNQITNLPALPGTLQQLICVNNQITNLPVLPGGLIQLDCDGNQLTSLPALPGTLQQLLCGYNNISCFPLFPNSLSDSNAFDLTPNPFSCMPNYVQGMPKAILAYPLCLPGNPNGCVSAYGIVGYTYKDVNNNCTRDNADSNLTNISVKVYDHSNNFLSQTYTAINGVYDFPDTGATYKVVIDTTGMPYKIQCTYPGADSLVTLHSIDTNINFSLTCKTGFDVGVQSVVTSGLIFPGMQHDLSVIAGDMSQWYNLGCANGDSGTVQITVSGPVTYVGPRAGALTPIVSGNVFTYHIPNFGAINNTTAFNLVLQTDASAKAGDTICVYVTVTPLADNNPVNNTYQYCYYVVNSHDPNNKQVYPVNVAPDYDEWFTYTIHFQNTGNAAASNIVITDALDRNLDLSTFQLINYSYENTVSLSSSGVLRVTYTDINLPDSIGNPTSSVGFVQYRIKPKANLPNGTIIKNTGYIYFDFNGAVVTNTTQNLFTKTLASVATITSDIACKVFPNPNNGTFTVSLQNIKEECHILVYNELGQEVYSSQLKSDNTQISLPGKSTGVYFYRILTENGNLVADGKLIIQ